MFTTKTTLRQRTPENGTNREQYLSLLLKEFINAKSKDARYQVLANLANFAYDPINYEYIRDLGILDILLEQLANGDDEKLKYFASAGLCNLCADPKNCEEVVKNGGIQLFIDALSSENDETVLNVITTLIYLTNHVTKPIIASENVINRMLQLKGSANRRLYNLAVIFLEDIVGGGN